MVNSLGERYQRPSQRQNKVITVTRNFASVNVNEAAFPSDWVNSHTLTLSIRQMTFPADEHTLKLRDWTFNPQSANVGSAVVDYVVVACILEYDPDGWRLKVPSSSHYSRAAVGDTNLVTGDFFDVKPKIGKQLVPPQRGRDGGPYPLDALGEAILEPGTDQAVGEWSEYDELDIRNLGFFAGISS